MRQSDLLIDTLTRRHIHIRLLDVVDGLAGPV